MATTYYVDGNAGSDGAAGTSFGTAYATIGKAASVYAAGDTVIICASATYTLTASVSWTTTGTVGLNVLITGANATGTVDGTQPTITSATNSVALFRIGANLLTFQNLKFTHTAGTRGNGIFCPSTNSNGITVKGCLIDGCQLGIQGDFNVGERITGLVVENTEIKNCISHAINCSSANAPTVLDGCYIHNNAGSGFVPGTATTGSASGYLCAVNTIFYSNLHAIHCSANAPNMIALKNCDILNSTGDGILLAQTTAIVMLSLDSNLIENNGGWGVNAPYAPVGINRNNAYRNNTSGNLNNVAAGTGDVALSGEPVTTLGSNFALNNTAGAGAACRAAGFPGATPGAVGTGYADIGALQHQDSGGGTPGMLYRTGGG